MKVICIDNKSKRFDRASERMLIQGEIYTASQCPKYSDSYDIAEALIDPMDGKKVSFGKRRFIPVSDVDETEMQREWQQVKQCIETL